MSPMDSFTARPRLHFFFRRRRPAEHHSIERLFETISAYLPAQKYDIVFKEVPYFSTGLLNRLKIILWCRLNQGEVNHITGDINFACMLMRRSTTVLTIHDCAPTYRLRGLSRLIFRVFWLFIPIKLCRFVTAISEQTRREISHLGWTPPSKITIIPNCITVARVDNRKESRRSSRPRILQVGTGKNKNVENVALALLRTPYERLDIIGKLSADQLKLLSELNIVYRNFVDISSSEVIVRFLEADVVVFASHYEGFGLPILEAQALSVPVVTSNLEPMRSVAGEGAVLVDPTSPESIADGIRRAVAEPFRGNLVAKGMLNARRYGPEIIASEYEKLYAQVCALSIRQE